MGSHYMVVVSHTTLQHGTVAGLCKQISADTRLLLACITGAYKKIL